MPSLWRLGLPGLGLAALAALGSCGSSADREPAVMVFASSSLTAAFEALAGAFEERHPDAAVDLHCAGTPQLVVQVREGAPVDVFASADAANMQRVQDGGHAAGPPIVLAENRLAIVVRRGNPKGIGGLADLARPDLVVALCGPGVPAGRYARQALARAGSTVRSVSDEPSVSAVLAKVELGELDAGIVYATDVRAASGRVDGVEIADEHNVRAAYPIAVLTAGSNRAAAASFVELALSEDGQRILRSFGFLVPR